MQIVMSGIDNQKKSYFVEWHMTQNNTIFYEGHYLLTKETNNGEHLLTLYDLKFD